MAKITQEFLEKALAHPVEHFEVNPGSNVGDGYLSLMYTIDVTLKSSHQVCHILLKCFPTNPATQKFVSQGNIFRKELLVYNTLVPELIQFQKEPPNTGQEIIKPPFPDFIYGTAVDYYKFDASESKLCTDPLENCIMMPDLRKMGGFKLANRIVGFDVDHLKLIVVAHAKLHSLSWAYKSQLKLSSLTDNKKLAFLGRDFYDDFGGQMYAPGSVDASMKLFREAIERDIDDQDERSTLLEAVDRLGSKTSEFLALYFCNGRHISNPLITKDNCLRVPGQVVGRGQEDECPWLVALHGDCWLNNMMFRYDETGKPIEVVLLDFQQTVEGDLMCDLCKVICTSTPPSFWKSHVPDLLKIYHDTFVNICSKFNVAPPWDFNLQEIQRRFHRGTAFGGALCLIALPGVMTDPNDMKNLAEAKEGTSTEDAVKETETTKMSSQISKPFQSRVVELIRHLYVEGII